MKRLITLLLSVHCCVLSAEAQTGATTTLKDTKSGNDEVFTYVDQMPEPTVNINEYLSKNIEYPKDARAKNISGKVVIKFVVNDRGYVEQVKVIQSVYPSLDSTAVAVVKKMPRWKPGRSEGKPVKVYYNLPIRFTLEDGDSETKPTPGYDVNAWIKTNLKYPQEAIDNKIDGSVIVGFTVKEDGSIVNASVSIGRNPLLDKEALRLVRTMPKWKPALKNGKAVSAYFAMPVAFTLKK